MRDELQSTNKIKREAEAYLEEVKSQLTLTETEYPKRIEKLTAELNETKRQTEETENKTEVYR